MWDSKNNKELSNPLLSWTGLNKSPLSVNDLSSLVPLWVLLCTPFMGRGTPPLPQQDICLIEFKQDIRLIEYKQCLNLSLKLGFTIAFSTNFTLLHP